MKRVNSESNAKQGLSIAESCASSTTVKKFSFDIHYDMVIQDVEVMAETLEEARQMAYDQAARLPLESMECVGKDACLNDTQELTERETRRMENEEVMKFVAEYVEQQAPTEVHDIADGYGVNWLEWVDDENETAFYNGLFRAISSCEHPRTNVFERYARMYARQRWQEVAKGQRWQFLNEWHDLTQDQKLVIETQETIYDANGDYQGNRYFMVSYFPPRTAAEPGYWMLTRCGDEYCDPADNIGWAAGTQAACRLTVGESGAAGNLCTFAARLINSGRVLDIYTV